MKQCNCNVPVAAIKSYLDMNKKELVKEITRLKEIITSISNNLSEYRDGEQSGIIINKIKAKKYFINKLFWIGNNTWILRIFGIKELINKYKYIKIYKKGEQIILKIK